MALPYSWRHGPAPEGTISARTNAATITPMTAHSANVANVTVGLDYSFSCFKRFLPAPESIVTENLRQVYGEGRPSLLQVGWLWLQTAPERFRPVPDHRDTAANVRFKEPDCPLPELNSFP